LMGWLAADLVLAERCRTPQSAPPGVLSSRTITKISSSLWNVLFQRIYVGYVAISTDTWRPASLPPHPTGGRADIPIMRLVKPFHEDQLLANRCYRKISLRKNRTFDMGAAVATYPSSAELWPGPGVCRQVTANTSHLCGNPVI
jgi:hypothetical protein